MKRIDTLSDYIDHLESVARMIEHYLRDHVSEVEIGGVKFRVIISEDMQPDQIAIIDSQHKTVMVRIVPEKGSGDATNSH